MTITSLRQRWLPLLFVVVVAASAGCGGDDAAGQQAWLHGTWELAFNPDQDDEDVLIFREDGTVEIRTVDGRTISGKYRVEDRDLTLLLDVDRQPVEVHFDIAAEGARLVYVTGAWYRKQSDAPVGP